MTQRKKYSKEFKIEAVKLITDEGYTLKNTAKSLGVRENMLWRWKKEHTTKGREAFSGNGKQCGMEEELRKLRAKNR